MEDMLWCFAEYEVGEGWVHLMFEGKFHRLTVVVLSLVILTVELFSLSLAQ